MAQPAWPPSRCSCSTADVDTLPVVELHDLDYPLPPEAIAQRPLDIRDASRLLVDRGPRQTPQDLHVHDLATLVGPGDVVVVNSSRVVPARLTAHKPTGGAVEVLLVEQLGDATWTAMVRPSRRVPVGTTLRAGRLSVVVGETASDGRTRTVEVRAAAGVDVREVLAGEAEVALPPYITEPLADAGRYQTVYADRAGSVAAPTAGLHLTAELLASIEHTGAEVCSVDLAVGLGTFLPVTAPRLDDHVMHHERFSVSPEVLGACEEADRVVAIGTTTVRALESAVRDEHGERTDLFIRPGFDFRVVDALLTNFHQPRSTLLALLAAFVGPRWRELYEHALGSDYRFLSFGDAMFVPTRDR